MRAARRNIVLALALAPFAPLAAGHEGHGAASAQASTPRPGSARVTLSDTALLDQDGIPRRLRSDVIGDRIAVVDFIYTTCTTACPVLSSIMAQVQKGLGEAAGDVALVSMSVDPARDSPAALKAHGAKHGARSGWLFLTGAVPTVTGVLKGFGAYAADPASHPPMILVGDGRTGEWSRYFGFPGPEQLIARVNELRRARVAAGAEKG